MGPVRLVRQADVSGPHPQLGLQRRHPGSGKLQGDHGAMTRAEALRRGVPILPPDRLLHRRCNAQRGMPWAT